MTADGLSLDDKRTPLLPEEKLGIQAEGLEETEHEKNNLPDVLNRWSRRNGDEQKRARTEQSFCVPKEDIKAQDYDLSLNRYKEIVYERPNTGHHWRSSKNSKIWRLTSRRDLLH